MGKSFLKSLVLAASLLTANMKLIEGAYAENSEEKQTLQGEISSKRGVKEKLFQVERERMLLQETEMRLITIRLKVAQLRVDLKKGRVKQQGLSKKIFEELEGDVVFVEKNERVLKGILGEKKYNMFKAQIFTIVSAASMWVTEEDTVQ